MELHAVIISLFILDKETLEIRHLSHRLETRPATQNTACCCWIWIAGVFRKLARAQCVVKCLEFFFTYSNLFILYYETFIHIKKTYESETTVILAKGLDKRVGKALLDKDFSKKKVKRFVWEKKKKGFAGVWEGGVKVLIG